MFLMIIFLPFIIANIQSISFLLDGNTKNCFVMGSYYLKQKCQMLRILLRIGCNNEIRGMYVLKLNGKGNP